MSLSIHRWERVTEEDKAVCHCVGAEYRITFFSLLSGNLLSRIFLFVHSLFSTLLLFQAFIYNRNA
jgi:hypothetical protein